MKETIKEIILTIGSLLLIALATEYLIPKPNTKTKSSIKYAKTP